MILTTVKMNKYNKYNFSEQCWSETVVLGVCYLGRGVSVVPAASVRSIQSLQRGRQAPPPVASSRQSPTPTPQRRLVPTAHLRRDERSDVRSTAHSQRTEVASPPRLFLPERGRRTRRRLPGVPACSWRAGWPRRGDSWGLGAHCPAGWTGSTSAGTGPG